MVSVIIPAFNSAQYIGEAIASVQAQTMSDFEILVVDDGSTDSTAAVLSGIDDRRIQTFRIERAGVSTARNVGLANARGEFIAFLDADDRWRPEYLERQVELLTSCAPLGACFTNFVRFNKSGFFPVDQFAFYPELRSLKSEAIPGKGFRIAGDAFTQLVSWSDFPAWSQTLVYRAQVIGMARFRPDLRLCEDAAFFFQVIARTQVGYISDPLVEVRRHDRNATRRIEDLKHAKLTALEHILSVAADGPQRTAAERRLSRQVVLLAREELMRGNWISALRRFFHAAYFRGALAFTFRSAATVPLRAMTRSIRGRTRHH